MNNYNAQSQAGQPKDLCRLLFETAADARLVLRQNKIVDYNAAALTLFETSPEQMLDQTFLSLSPALQPDGGTSELVWQDHMATINDGEPYFFEWLHHRPNGQPFYAELGLSWAEFEGEIYLQVNIRDISHHKQVELDLGREHGLMLTLINAIPDFVYAKDMAGRFIMANTAAAHQVGLASGDELLGKTDLDVVPNKALAEQYYADEQAFIQSGKPLINLEQPGVDAAGNEQWYLTTKVFIKDEQGEAVGYIGLSHNITERKQMEESMHTIREKLEERIESQTAELRAANEQLQQEIAERQQIEQGLRTSEERLRAYVNSLPDISFIMDAEGRYVEVLVAADHSRYQGAVERLTGKFVHEFMTPEQAELFITTIDKTIVSREPQSLEYTLQEQGEERWFEGRVLPLQLAHEDFDAVVWLARDITDRKLAEQALQLTQFTVDRVAIDTLWVGPDAQILYVNDQACQTLGYSHQELLGMTIFDLDANPNTAQNWPRRWAEFERRRSFTFETTHLRKNGEVFPVEVTINYIEFEDQAYICASVRDVTESKQMEQAIRESLDRRGRQIQLSTQIAQEAAALTDVDKIFQYIVTQIKEQLGLYHTQLLRYSSDKEVLKLAAGYGEPGKQMLADGYQISKGEGLIGQAASAGISLLRPDLTSDPTWQPVPYLPDTKGEIAVPIKLGNQDVYSQVEAIESLVESGYNGLIVAAIEPDVVRPTVKKAVDAGVCVVSHNDFGEAAGQTALLEFDDFGNGYQLGQQAGEWAKAQGFEVEALQVAIFNEPTIPQVVQREAGMVAGLADALGSQANIVATAVASDPTQATRITHEWLQTYPNLTMILAINDSGALGAYTTIVRENKNDASQFFIGGIDAIDEALVALGEGGAFQATIEQSPRDLGVLSVRALVAAITGQLQTSTIQMKSRLVNQANLAEFMAERQNRDVDEIHISADSGLSRIKLGFSVMNLNNPFWAAMARAATEEAARLGIELIVNDPKPVVGVLNVHSNTPGLLTAEDQLFLEGVAGQIAAAIEYARLLDEANVFRQFVETAGQGMGFSTMEGRMVYMNPAFAKILGEPSGEATANKFIAPYLSKEDLERLQDEVMPQIFEQGYWSGELALRTLEGKVVPALQTFTLIKDQNGMPQYVSNVATDFTERKRAEAELEARLQELNTLQRLMSREGWQDYQAKNQEIVPGYLFDEVGVHPLPAEKSTNGHSHTESSSQTTLDNTQPAVKPVTLRGEVIGQIGIYDNTAEQPLTNEDQEFLDLIAGELSEALERARLMEQTQKRAVELEAVAQVSTVASSTLEKDKMLQTVVDLTTEQFGLYHAHIYMLNSAGDTLVLQAGAGQPGRQMVVEDWNISLDNQISLVARTARTRQSVLINNVHQQPDFLPNPHLPNTCSELSVPMIVGHNLLGVLDVQADVTDHFTNDDVQIMTTLASQIAVALQNANLIQQTQIALAETKHLYDINAALSSATTVEDVLQTVVDHAQETKVNSAALMTIDVDAEGEPEWLEIVASWNYQEEPFTRLTTHFYIPEYSMSDLWIDNPEPMLISDILTDDRIGENAQALYKQLGIRGSINLPLRLGNRWIGLVALNWTTPQEFTRQDVRLYQAITAQMSVVLNNLLQIQETQKALAETEILYESSRQINEARDMSEMAVIIGQLDVVPIFDRVSLITLDRDISDEAIALRVVASWTADESLPFLSIGARYLLAEFSGWNRFITSEPVLIENIQALTDWNEVEQELVSELNIKAVASLPLYSGTQQLGFLLLQSQAPHQFTIREMQPYVALAGQIAIALENQRLLEETRVALAEVEAVQRRYTVQAWETYHQQQQNKGYEKIGDQTSTLDITSLPIDETQLVAGIRTGQTIVTDPEREASQTGDKVDDKNDLSHILAPVAVRNEIIGVLGVQDTTAERVWTPEEIELVETIATQIAQAAENIRLVDETQQRVARERRLNEISEKIQAAQSLDDALQIAIKEVGLSLKTPQTSVLLEID